MYQRQMENLLCVNRLSVRVLIDKDVKEKEKAVAEATQLAVPRLSVCADAQKIDKTKLAQTEVSKRLNRLAESATRKKTLTTVLNF